MIRLCMMSQLSPRVVTWKDKPLESASKEQNELPYFYDDTDLGNFTDTRESTLELDKNNLFVTEIQGIEYEYNEAKVEHSFYEKSQFEF